MERKTNADRKNLQLYAITDRHWLNGRTLYSVVKESLEGGVTFLQLREKNWMKNIFWRKPENCRSFAGNIRFPLW